MIEINGGDSGNNNFEDANLIKVAYPDSELPEISEIVIHNHTKDKFVAGLSVYYRNGTSYVRMGGCSDPTTPTSFKLHNGEYITQVWGRTGSWSDKIGFMTNRGRSVEAGGTGGNENKPEFPSRAYVIGFDLRFHTYLTRTSVHYVDLSEVPLMGRDPLTNLIFESNLLTKGLE